MHTYSELPPESLQKQMEINIIPATPDDAPFIAQVVLGAIGKEHTLEMASSPDRLPLVEQVFTNLAAMDNSQYSYRNTLLAVTPGREYAGAVVNYDGAALHSLRRAFISEANRLLDWGLKVSDFPDETSPDELYLDSLMVLPKYRRNGIGTKLIEAVRERGAALGKPVGLLVDFGNPNARRLYTALGFRSVGQRPFAGKTMEHLRLPLQQP